MDYFGSTDPREMPGHFFSGSIHKDYSRARRADVSKQNFSVCPRHWYFDVTFVCEDCEQNFVWLAEEQKLWFEDYGHYVDAQATRCKPCRFLLRRIKELRKEYDQVVVTARSGNAQEDKIKIIGIVDTLESLGFALPPRMSETAELFRRQVYG